MIRRYRNCGRATAGVVLVVSFLTAVQGALSDKDCVHFTTRQEAPDNFESNGGSRYNNLDLLEEDRDAQARESIPGYARPTDYDIRRSSQASDAGDFDTQLLDSPATNEDDSSLSWWWIAAGLAAAGGGYYYFTEVKGEQNQRVKPVPGRKYDPRSMAYDAYLQTDEWKQIREMAFQRDGRKCTKCGSTQYLQAHHLNYSRRGREKLKDLTTLCSTCHQRHHEKC